MEDDRKGIPLLYMFIGMMITATLVGGYFIVKILTTETPTDETNTTAELSLSKEYTGKIWYGAEEITDYLDNAIILNTDKSYQFIVSENNSNDLFSYEEGYYIVIDLDTIALFPTIRSFTSEEGEELEYNGWILSIGAVETEGETSTIEISGIYINNGAEAATMYLYNDSASNLDSMAVTEATE